jgi:hypothetical protein
MQISDQLNLGTVGLIMSDKAPKKTHHDYR